MKKITFYILAIVCLAFMAASCQIFDLDTPVVRDGDRVTVPFRIKATFTKVSYAGGEYSLKAGDKIAITCASRDDVSGELSYVSTSNWEGSVTYTESEGDLDGVTLTATLVHADNSDTDTYANGISNSLQSAVENFSLFTADFDYDGTGSASVTLQQQACFLDATVTLNFENGNFHLTGETSVDVIVDGSLTVSGRANLAQVGETTSYSANFVIAMPGGTILTDASVIQICDRDVQMIKTGTTKTLAANHKYAVIREVDFVPQLGDPFWSDGTYGRIAHDPGVSITGIIVFVNNYEDSDLSKLAAEARALTEYIPATLSEGARFGHALVMSLKNAGTSIKWATSNTSNGIPYITTPSAILETTNVSGYSNTTTLIANADNAAATTAHNYRSGEGDTMTSTTGWFLPSIGQWVYSISTRGFGGADEPQYWINGNPKYENWLTKGSLSDLVFVKNNHGDNQNLLITSLNNRMQVLKDQFDPNNNGFYDEFGMYYLDPKDGDCYADNYWSSTETSAAQAIRMNFGSVESYNGDYYSTIKVKGENKTSTSSWKSAFKMKVRPFLAF